MPSDPSSVTASILPTEPGLEPGPTTLRRHAERRESFLERVGAGVAVIPAARVLHKSRDTEVRFRQDSDFHYLTGFAEPDAVAVLTPHDPKHRFTLFVRPRDAEREAWEGRRAGVDGARERYGADAAYPIDELGDRLADLLLPADRAWFALGADAELDRRVVDLVRAFRRKRQRTGQGPVDLEDPGTVLGEMRLIKDADELAALRLAGRAAAAGHCAAMAATLPGRGEWEVEAALESTWRALGALGPAFPSIVASGPNATVLHYTTNDRRIEDGDLVLIDAGAEVSMYCADVTRTFPASGRFTAVQRRVYEVVLAAQRAAIDAVRPGVAFAEIHGAARRVLVQGMVDLGLLSGEVDALIEEEAYKRFYLHQTSHWLGLDVHDVGFYARAGESTVLRPGMVLTIEPGLYVAADADGLPAELRGIGVRIEDDLVVTEDGHENLTAGAPVEVDEIEALVGSEPGGGR